MNTLWTIVEVTVNFLEIAIIYYFISTVLEKKYSNMIIACSAIFTGAVFSVINHYNIQNASGIASISIYVIIFTSIVFMYKGTTIRKGMMLMLSFMIILMSDTVAVLSVSLISGVNLKMLLQSNYYRFTAIVFSKFFSIIIIYYYSRRKNPRHSFNISNNYVMAMLSIFILNIATVVVLILSYRNITEANAVLEKYLFLTTFFIGCIFVYTFVLFNKLAEKTENEIRAEFETERDSMEKQYHRNIDQMLGKISTLKHDMKNHLLYIYNLYKNEDYSSAGKYLERYLKDIDSEDIVIINNTFLGAFLNNKISLAKKKQISVRTEIKVNREILIEDFDMSVVLGNILDNAVEANMSVKPERRFIEFGMSTVEEYLKIEVSNKKSGKSRKSGEEYITKKTDKNNHGYGIKSVKNIVGKYFGDFKTEESADTFTVKIIMLNSRIDTE